jgi:hypothetical protein
MDGRESKGYTFVIFESCKREALERAPARLGALKPGTIEAMELCNIQAAVPVKFSDRLLDIGGSSDGYYDVALHNIPGLTPSELADAFFKYAALWSFRPSGTGSPVSVGDITFLQVHGERGGLMELCRFLPLRDICESGLLKHSPATGDNGSTSPGQLDSSSTSGEETEGRQTPDPVSKTIEIPPPAEDLPYPLVAVFDAGFGNLDPIMGHLKNYELASSDAGELPDALGHGQGVLTRYLFDEVDENGKLLCAPLTRVFAIRVLDTDAMKDDPRFLTHALLNIMSEMSKTHYDIVTLSLGPDVPAQDGAVSLWTSTLDRLAYEHDALIIVAAGNNGEANPASPAGRVESPGDGFSTLAVGAGHCEGDVLIREEYSACGPGCSIVSVKPDIICWGGNQNKLLSVLQVSPELGVVYVLGTSFCPSKVARSSAALMIMGGPKLTKCSVKGVIAHYADPMGADPREVGWGLLVEFDPAGPPPEPRCLIYQGVLSRDHFSRVELNPVFEAIPPGTQVNFKATFRFERKPDHSRPHERGLKSLVPYLVKDPSAAPDANGYPPEHRFFKRKDDGVHFHNLFSDSGEFATDDLRNAVIDIRYADPGNIHCLIPDVPFSLVLSAEIVKPGDVKNSKGTGYR